MQELREVENPDRATVFSGCLSNPGVASRIPQNNRVGARIFDIAPFAIKQSAGHLGLGEVVCACGAAAEVGFCKFNKLNARHGPNEVSRSLSNALAVGKVAGVVIGDAPFPTSPGQVKIGDGFAEIEGGDAAFLQPASASRRVGDDRLLLRFSSDGFCPLTTLFEHSCMRMKSPAATQIGAGDAVPGSRKQILRGGMDIREENAHGAAFKEGDLFVCRSG